MLSLSFSSLGSTATTNPSTMADPPTNPFARGLIIPPTVCDDVLDTRAHSDWDDIENYVFTEITAITQRFSDLCDAADKGDASAIHPSRISRPPPSRTTASLWLLLQR